MYSNYLDLIEYLEKYAAEQNIDCIWCDICPDYIPCSSTKDRVIFMNINWRYPLNLPFAFAYEIGHVVHGDQHTTAKTKLAKKQEKAADLYAVGLIWGYCLKMGIDPTTCGIPTRYI